MSIFRRILLSCTTVAVCCVPVGCATSSGTRVTATGPNGLPGWAYHVIDAVQPEKPQAKGPVRLPGSTREYDASVTQSIKEPPDWYPEEHPPAPRIVAGAKDGPAVACGSCHMMLGQGHPENADLAGLPVNYFIRQMEYFRTGARKEPARMNEIAPTLSDEDIRSAAEYFAVLKRRPLVKVIESTTVPRTYVSTTGRMRMLHPEGGTEPLGRRVIQLAVDPVRTANRDPYATYIAYVPPGSIAKGARLVTTGGSGKTLPCASCHGEGLRGAGDVPRIAGLQPGYVARQLIGMQNGASAGAGVETMKPVVAKLSEDDVIAISAYIGTLPP